MRGPVTVSCNFDHPPEWHCMICAEGGRITVARVAASDARKDLRKILDRVFYQGEVVIVTRNGKDFATVVPMSMLPGPFKPTN